MRVLVTGGAGFIGSHLCDTLLGREHEVICVDSMFTGSKRNIRPLFESPYFEFIRHDITVPLFCEVDYIYNLACPAAPRHYQYDPIHTFKTAVMGTLNMLGLAKRTGARLLQASTSEVYGDPDVSPQPETYKGILNFRGPRACYDEGKRGAETLIHDYMHIHGLDVRTVRIFNTYGPKMALNDGRVVSNFIIQALRGEDITIYGTGEQTRSFCFVDDLIRGMINYMNVDRNSGRSIPDVINFGNPHEITILQLAKLVLQLTDSKSKLVFKDLPVDDPCQRRPDIKVATETLSWKPTIALEQGLEWTIDYYKSCV